MMDEALVRLLSRPKRAILAELKGSRPLTAAVVAKRIGVSRQAAAYHLKQMVAAGVAKLEVEPQGPNAPRRFYSLVRESDVHG